MIADLRPTASSKDSLLGRYMQRFQEKDFIQRTGMHN